MDPDEQRRFLDEGRKLTLATHGPEGSIHLVTMHYLVWNDQVTMLTKHKSQKVKNVRRDPTASCLIESGDEYRMLKGVSLNGSMQIIDDPDLIFEIGVRFRDKLHGGYGEGDRPMVELAVHNRVALSLAADRVVSWDHSRAPLPPSHGGPG